MNSHAATDAATPAWVKTAREGLLAFYQRLDRVFASHPFAQLGEFFRTHPQRMNLFYAEIGWLLLILGLRHWRFKKCTTRLGLFWCKLWTGTLFLVGAGLVLPWVIFGQAYFQAFTEVLELLLK